MAKLVATVHVYDSLQLVTWALTVRRYVGYNKPGKTVVLEVHGTFPGVGEDDPRAWLRRALLEAVTKL
jgi:hypothetical protein